MVRGEFRDFAYGFSDGAQGRRTHHVVRREAPGREWCVVSPLYPHIDTGVIKASNYAEMVKRPGYPEFEVSFIQRGQVYQAVDYSNRNPRPQVRWHGINDGASHRETDS